VLHLSPAVGWIIFGERCVVLLLFLPFEDQCSYSVAQEAPSATTPSLTIVCFPGANLVPLSTATTSSRFVRVLLAVYRPDPPRKWPLHESWTPSLFVRNQPFFCVPFPPPQYNSRPFPSPSRSLSPTLIDQTHVIDRQELSPPHSRRKNGT